MPAVSIDMTKGLVLQTSHDNADKACYILTVGMLSEGMHKPMCLTSQHGISRNGEVQEHRQASSSWPSRDHVPSPLWSYITASGSHCVV